MKIIKLIKQPKGEPGCGIACVAMLANEDYAQVKEKYLSKRPKPKILHTKLKDLCWLLTKYNFKVEKTKFKSWDEINAFAIVAVNQDGNYWHWVLTCKNGNDRIILDPEFGELRRLSNFKRTYRPIENKYFIAVAGLSEVLIEMGG